MLEANSSKNMIDTIRNWAMIVLTLIFVVFYAAALLGWLKPLSEVIMVTRLEPIIFVIIGYYFGRMPAQQNEQTLKEEIIRQTQKSDAAQQAKEKANQEREALEEKIKNARAALKAASFDDSLKLSGESNRSVPTVTFKEQELRSLVAVAAKILNS
jgi:predicted membrane protein